MCDLLRIEVVLIHPEDDNERQAGHDVGIKGVLSITSGGKDVPLESDVTADDVIGAVAGALDIIRDGLEREWARGRAEQREAKARQN